MPRICVHKSEWDFGQATQSLRVIMTNMRYLLTKFPE